MHHSDPVQSDRLDLTHRRIRLVLLAGKSTTAALEANRHICALHIPAAPRARVSARLFCHSNYTQFACLQARVHACTFHDDYSRQTV